jgi:uncharacterized membrane protein YcaP (DUF421 family)
MFEPSIDVPQLVARGVLVYFFLLLILRLTGKRQIGQLAPFDLVLLLILSNAVQNAMNGGDNSVSAGVISATTLIACNGVVSRLTARFKWMEGVIEGRPVVLVHNGAIIAGAMDREKVTHHELMAALRGVGCAHLAEVHFAVLENSGHISVVLQKEHHHAAPDSMPGLS